MAILVLKATIVVLGGIILFLLDRQIRNRSDDHPFTPFVFLAMVFGGHYYGIDGLLAAILFGVLLGVTQRHYSIRNRDMDR